MSAVSGVSGQSGQQANTSNAYDKLDVDSFIKMMVAELQNQDPTNPTSSNEILQQVSQIRSLQSTETMTQTLESVQLGQNLASASGLLKQNITGLANDGKAVSGVVDRVTISDSVPTLHVGDQSVALQNVTAILPDGAGTTNTATSGS
jgi:flagellar basal-body rod modification protein FlgD